MGDNMNQIAVLIVDDDPSILSIVNRYLTHAGFDVKTALTAQAALDTAELFSPDCVLLDVNLPDRSGLNICEVLKEMCGCSVIFLSCMSAEDDRISGFESGGDDYVTKPFSLKELEHRIRKRVEATMPRIVTKKERRIVIDSKTSISVDNIHLKLTTKELALLSVLMNENGPSLSAEDLFERIWQAPVNDDARVVAVHIANLRRKIRNATNGYDPIETVWGGGYRYVHE